MQYLPIYPEKNWDQTVLWYDYWGPAGESLPVTNTFLDAARGFSQLARQANNPIERWEDVIYWLWNLGGSVIVWPIVDTVWNIWNTAYNWYKRLYNYWANAYNNVADAYNNWQRQRDNPQTSLTWRKLTFDMNPAYYNQTIAIAEKPKQYLVWADWNIVAEVKDPYPYVSRVVQAQQLGPSQEERRNMMPVAAVQSN